jgi:hypothetical protein
MPLDLTECDKRETWITPTFYFPCIKFWKLQCVLHCLCMTIKIAFLVLLLSLTNGTLHVNTVWDRLGTPLCKTHNSFSSWPKKAQITDHHASLWFLSLWRLFFWYKLLDCELLKVCWRSDCDCLHVIHRTRH